MENKKLENIPSGTHIFVDTNILIYHLMKDEFYAKSCKDFLRRIEENDLVSFISPIVISETLFLYLRLQIIKNNNINPKKVLNFIKQNRGIIGDINLEKPQKLFSIFKQLHTNNSIINSYYQIIKTHNLLPNDAMNLAIVLHHNIPAIATLDKDFDKMEDIEIFKPDKIVKHGFS